MALFRKKQQAADLGTAGAQRGSGFEYRLAPSESFQQELYDSLRANVPIIDACFGKIIRLTGGFRVLAEDERAQEELDRFCREVSVGVSGRSLFTFADMYLDSLLTYGKAIGRIYADRRTGRIKGVYVGDASLYRVCQGKDPLTKRVFYLGGGQEVSIRSPEKLLYTALNPSPKHPDGVSILRGLPALSQVLMRIYECIGQNFDRVGNVRYAVTYRPDGEGDRARAKERAQQIAEEWAKGMRASRNGAVQDFVAVGDVDIKVIGADNQVIDTEIPVRQLMEQLVAKLSIPPFLLGLNWSSTERMSEQQADILTSELEYYRRLLSPVLEQICEAFLRLQGYGCSARVEWDNINLQDEEALARSRLYNAQAEQLEREFAQADEDKAKEKKRQRQEKK
ncbi:serine/threonine protein phosphatase [Ruminococcus sp.]|uniref:serine/threonine protein phosphatase n=1 Tax=Ruminococcus sp. TaxID=41978 RepID=UPI0025D890A8|nr:serine/threonine protein phosphatase [Ruminococcus sp.]